ncbi:MAG TPA: RNA polymerase sigma factor [Solirubrobacteraceae bacterium]|jgi:RNA polymerase sigma-70 factor (ECF subfamily)
MQPAQPSDQQLMAGLRAGDEMAFRTLVNRHHNAMRRLAVSLVASPAIADEVVQETWLAVIRGIDRFEERSSLKTWIFRILVNRARSLGGREARTTPFSSLQSAGEDEGPTVDPERFLSEGHAFGGYWSVPPTRFFELPEARVLAAESAELIERTIGELPARQQQVIRMRDVDGWGSQEVCDCLGLSEANQRVLLHRARARVRSVLEAHFSELVHA